MYTIGFVPGAMKPFHAGHNHLIQRALVECDQVIVFTSLKDRGIIKGERIKIKGYLEEFALSKAEADNLVMSARDKVYKDWKMGNGEKKIKVINIWKYSKNF